MHDAVVPLLRAVTPVGSRMLPVLDMVPLALAREVCGIDARLAPSRPKGRPHSLTRLGREALVQDGEYATERTPRSAATSRSAIAE